MKYKRLQFIKSVAVTLSQRPEYVAEPEYLIEDDGPLHVRISKQGAPDMRIPWANVAGAEMVIEPPVQGIAPTPLQVLPSMPPPMKTVPRKGVLR